MTDGADDSELDPEAAFSLPAHEIRIGILTALWEATGHSLPYAELRDRVGVRDSGQFSYHLSRVEGRFVGHADEEYYLLYPGHRMLDALRSGALNREIDLEPLSVRGDCPHCGGDLAFSYGAVHGWVTCDDCDALVLRFPFDPAGVATNDASEIPAAFDRTTRRFWLGLLEGVCPQCSSPVETELVDPEAPLEYYDDFFADGQPSLVHASCQHCSVYSFVPPGVTLLGHPGALGWLYERGIDVRERRCWELPFVVDPAAVRPLEDERDGVEGDAVEVTATAEDEQLRAIVGPSAKLLALERE